MRRAAKVLPLSIQGTLWLRKDAGRSSLPMRSPSTTFVVTCRQGRHSYVSISGCVDCRGTM